MFLFLCQLSKSEVEETLGSKLTVIEELETRNSSLQLELASSADQHGRQTESLQTDLEQHKAQLSQKTKR